MKNINVGFNIGASKMTNYTLFADNIGLYKVIDNTVVYLFKFDDITIHDLAK